MSVVIYCEAKQQKPEKEMVFDYSLINEICKNTWSSYYTPNTNKSQYIPLEKKKGPFMCWFL